MYLPTNKLNFHINIYHNNSYYCYLLVPYYGRRTILLSNKFGIIMYVCHNS